MEEKEIRVTLRQAFLCIITSSVFAFIIIGNSIRSYADNTEYVPLILSVILLIVYFFLLRPIIGFVFNKEFKDIFDYDEHIRGKQLD